MQKWEYKTLYRMRTTRLQDNVLWGDEWYAWLEDDKEISNKTDIDIKIRQLGEQGWELVTVAPRSGMAGGIHSAKNILGGRLPSPSSDFAGFSSEELWVFKRPKE